MLHILKKGGAIFFFLKNYVTQSNKTSHKKMKKKNTTSTECNKTFAIVNLLMLNHDLFIYSELFSFFKILSKDIVLLINKIGK